MSAAIVYYTDHRLSTPLAHLCSRQLLAASADIPIVTVGLNAPCDFGATRLRLDGERGIVTMHRQILLGLEAVAAEYAFLAEHDVLYHPSHFEFAPPNAETFYYNTNVYKVRYPDGLAIWTDDCQQVSGLCAARGLLVSFYQQRLAQIASTGFNRHYEPGLKQSVGGQRVENWQSAVPNLDIRHGGNLTPTKYTPAQFRNPRYARGWRTSDSVSGWGATADVLGERRHG